MLTIQRMALHPSTSSILEEIVTWTYRGVKIGGVDTRRKSLSRCRSGNEQTGY